AVQRHAGPGVLFAVGVDEPVDDVFDFAGALAYALDVLKDFVDGAGAGGNGHDHVAQAVFDALGDFDLAFASQQFDGTHFAHVRADRVGGAAEVGIDGGQGHLGFILAIVVVGTHRGGGAHEQRFSVGRLVVGRDPHVAEGADDAVDGLGVDQVV